MNIRYFIFILLIASLVFFAGIYIGHNIEDMPGLAGGEEMNQAAYESGYQAGLEYAGEKIRQNFPADTHSLLGVIKEIDGQNIKIEYDASSLDILSEGKAIALLSVGEDTKIEKRTEKNEEEFDKEKAEFIEKARQSEGTEETLPAPRPYIIEELAFSDLKAGDVIETRSDNAINISDGSATPVMEIIILANQ